MKKCISFGLLLVLMMSLVMFASCAKRPPEPEDYPPDEQPMDIRAAERAEVEAELERQRRFAEEELEGFRDRELTPDEKAARVKKEMDREAFLESTVYFAFDNSSLTTEAREILLRQARWLKENGDATVIIEGHCDNRGTEEYNLALGSRRAQSVKDFLVNAGVEPSRIVTISYGEERPAVQGDNEEAWAKNRRAEFRLR